MPRIAGVNVNGKKRAEIGLTAIFGIGRSLAKEILAKANIDINVKLDDLMESELDALRKIIDSNDYVIEGDLRREEEMAKKRLRDIRCYRGIRHQRGLPVRGQRTHTNARTRKGKKKAIK
jgi:small subunit ribosomal protein S13